METSAQRKLERVNRKLADILRALRTMNCEPNEEQKKAIRAGILDAVELRETRKEMKRA